MPRPPRSRPNDRDGRSQHGRRKPPQAAPDEERRFLYGRLKSGSRLAVEMTDGSRTLGVIRAFSEETIELQTDDQSGLLLHKSQIRYIEELD